MSEVSSRVRGPVIQGEPRDAELLRECIFSYLPRERRRASVLGFKGGILVSVDTSSLHIQADCLLHLLVDPLLQLLIFRDLALLLRPFVHVAAAGAFFSLVPVTPLTVEDVPQVLSVARTPGRRALILLAFELLLEPLDKLTLFLDEAVLCSDVLQAGVFVPIKAGLVMGL